MKKVYIVHGWGGSPISEPWFNWLIEELERKRYFVDIFDMPNTDNPKIEEWVKFLEKKVKHPDKDTFFVGHSIGCQTILRYLEKLHKGLQIGGCAFVAPWFDLINQEPEELEIAHPWTTTKIDFSRILEHCRNFECLFSDNDPYVHIDEAQKFKENLGAKIIFRKNEGHFNSTEKIPEIMKFFE